MSSKGIDQESPIQQRMAEEEKIRQKVERMVLGGLRSILVVGLISGTG
jgi:hypothetical protein